jgi:hypothetical protein
MVISNGAFLEPEELAYREYLESTGQRNRYERNIIKLYEAA